MAAIEVIMQLLLAPKGALFWSSTLAAGLAAACIFFLNSSHRHVVEQALLDANPRQPQLSMFENCGAGALSAVGQRALTPPERLWCYDSAYLDKFMMTAGLRNTQYGDSALAHYVTPTLKWNDIAFAVFLGAFTFLSAIGLGSMLPMQPWAGYVMVFCAVMGAAYGIIDVLEDFTLVRILEKGAPADPSAAATANTLTRIKLAAIFLSGIGGLVFLLFTLVARMAGR